MHDRDRFELACQSMPSAGNKPYPALLYTIIVYKAHI
jgi:hypothetical protein